MCGPHPIVKTDLPALTRANLTRALERLPRRRYCDDAQLVLAAARKHLDTMPPETRYRVYQTGYKHHPPSEIFDTWLDAAKHAHEMISLGCTVNIDKV